MNIQALKLLASRKVGRGILIIKKASPEILLVAGIGGIVVTTVLIMKQASKAEAVLEESKAKLAKVHEAKATVPLEDYSEQDYKKDLLIVATQTVVNVAKVYWAPVTLGLLSIGLILASHGIMKQRTVALAGLVKLVEGQFIDYREKVIAEYGEDKDRQFRFGTTTVTSTETVTDEDGKKTKVKKTTEVAGDKTQSMYAQLFDERSIHWKKDHSFNLVFIQCQQNFANEMLQVRGHVFLNEVYDSLGLPRTKAGAIVGWVREDEGEVGMTPEGGLRRYQTAIDFGVFDVENPPKVEFIKGNERSIWLDFNVDGVIYDLI